MNICEILRNNKRDLIEYYISGKSINDIGKIFCCDPNMVAYILKEQGVKFRGPRRYSLAAKERYYCLIQHMSSILNLGVEKISKKLNISRHFVLKCFKELKIDYSKRKRKISRNMDNKIISFYKQGFSTNDIGLLAGISHGSVVRILKQNKVSTRPCKIYSFREDILTNGIDSPDLAWMWGLWLSDGTCYNLGVKIGMCDIDGIQKVKEIFKSTSPIRTYKKGVNNQDIHILNICSTKLSRRFTELGCMPNKTHIVDFPKHISDELMPHFIRGLWDGDGFVSPNGTGITGNILLLEGIKDKLISILGIDFDDIKMYGNHIERYPNSNNIKNLFITNVISAKIFLDWIYKESYEEARLNRKYIRYCKYWHDRPVEKRKRKVITGNIDYEYTGV